MKYLALKSKMQEIAYNNTIEKLFGPMIRFWKIINKKVDLADEEQNYKTNNYAKKIIFFQDFLNK